MGKSSLQHEIFRIELTLRLRRGHRALKNGYFSRSDRIFVDADFLRYDLRYIM